MNDTLAKPPRTVGSNEFRRPSSLPSLPPFGGIRFRQLMARGVKQSLRSTPSIQEMTVRVVRREHSVRLGPCQKSKVPHGAWAWQRYRLLREEWEYK